MQQKNNVSSNKCSKIFGLCKLRNFRTPNKSDKGQNTPFLVTHFEVKINNAIVEKRIGYFGGEKSLLFRIKSYLAFLLLRLSEI